MNSRDIRHAVHELLSDALVSSELIEADNFKRYATAPADDNASPYFGFVATYSHDLERGTTGGDFINPRVAIWGFARIGEDENSKEEAQDWLDFFEETVIGTLAESDNAQYWIGIKPLGQPRRNPDPQYHGRYQVSALNIEIEER